MSQGSAEWKQARAGIPTASQFSRIVTGTAKVASAKVQRGYMMELLAQRFDAHEEWQGNNWTNRGLDLEEKALQAYQFVTDYELDKVSFETDGMIGGSPDSIYRTGLERFVTGGVEVKCFGAKQHLEIVVAGVVPVEIRPQVFGYMKVFNARWWDFFGWHPKLKPLLVRTEATDESYIKWREVFDSEVEKFCQKLDELEEQLQN